MLATVAMAYSPVSPLRIRTLPLNARVHAYTHAGLHNYFRGAVHQFASRRLIFKSAQEGHRDFAGRLTATAEGCIGLQTLFDFEREGHVSVRCVLKDEQILEAHDAVVGHLNKHLKDAYVFKVFPNLFVLQDSDDLSRTLMPFLLPWSIHLMKDIRILSPNSAWGPLPDN